MEGWSPNNIATDGSGSSETAESGRGSENLDGASQTPRSLPSLPVSVPSDEATLLFEDQRSQTHEVNSTFRPHFQLRESPSNIESYQPLTAHVAGSPEAWHGGPVDPVENVESPTAASKSKWRPKYLRRRVLAGFNVVFLLMIVALELLSLLSNRNDGIAKGFNKDHYLWTYGPTAFLTLVAALFNRVEYQAKMMAPWARLYNHPAPARTTLLLDYVSAFQPVAIYQSLRNRDIAVAATTTVSVLIKILIVLSSGLITLSRVGVHYGSIPMEIQNAFIDDDSTLRAESTFSSYIMQGLIEGNRYPPGISNKFAFQSVKSQLPDTAEYQVTVDGLTTSLRCETAVLNMTGIEPFDMEPELKIANYTITSPGCSVIFPFGDSLSRNPQSMPHQEEMGLFMGVQCDGTSDDAGKRVLILFWVTEWFVNEATPSCTGDRCTNVLCRVLKSSLLLCTPTYEITKVNVVQNGTAVRSVMPVHQRPGESSNRTLHHVSPWSIMEAYFYAFTEGIMGLGSSALSTVSRKNFNGDVHIQTMLRSQLKDTTDMSLLYNPDFVRKIAAKYYQQVGAIIAQQLLLKPASLHTTGSAISMADRLIVREWAVQWMIGLVAICIVLSTLTAFFIPQHKVLHQCPSTLPGIAALVAQSPQLLELLRYSGDADSKPLHLRLEEFSLRPGVTGRQLSGLGQHQQYLIIEDDVPPSAGRASYNFHQTESTHSHPWILHPASRLGLSIVLIAVIVTLEMTLHQSSTHDGLGNVGEIAYIHYTWTSIPAVVFGGLAMVISSIDFSIRSLAPYISLSNFVSADSFKNLDFLDTSVPSAIVKEGKLRNIGALATTTTLLVASFFTIFAGSLFQGVVFSSTTSILLRANSSFRSTGIGTSSGANAPLILLSNLSYPSFTYEDLAFPQLLPTMPFVADEFSDTSLLSIKAVVPALRSHLGCRLYDKNMIHFQIEHRPDLADTIPSAEWGLSIAVDEGCHASAHFQVDAPSNISYFGVDFMSTRSDRVGSGYIKGCSDLVLVWGKIASLAEFKIDHIAAVGCNESIEAVDVEANFIGADLAIDMRNPPRPLPGTERNSTAAVDWDRENYFSLSNLPDISTDEALSEFFALLTQSRWAIPVSMLGGGSDEAVAAAIKFQRGILLAQTLDKVRVPAAETNTTLTPEQALEGENDAERTFNATVVDNAGRQRVVQDAISTRVLEALLLVTLVLLGVGWAWLPKTNVLPKRSPTTIASAVALLAGGNLEEWVHEIDRDHTGGRGTTTTQRFWLGWGNVPDEEGILMGNENENGISRFGIFAIKVDKIDA